MNEHRFPGVVAAQREGRVLADNAAGAQVPAETIARMHDFLSEHNAQKGSHFARTERTTALIAEAKDTFAELIGVAPGTTGIGLNATSLAVAFARNLAHIVQSGDRIVVTAADHAANMVPWSWLTRFGAALDIIPVDDRGELDEDAFGAALAREPILVALPWASNATGTVYDIARFSALAKDAGAIVVADGVQAAPHLRIAMPETVDFAFFSAYKIFAPHVGMFYTRPDVAHRLYRPDDDLLPSAPINWAIEFGTQCHEGWAGWLGTVDYLRELGEGSLPLAMDRIAAEEAALTRHARHGFAERSAHITLYGRQPDRERLPVFAFNIRGRDPDAVARALDTAGIEARVGNYYSPRLLRALASDFNATAIRLSLAHYNTIADVDRCFAALDTIYV